MSMPAKSAEAPWQLLRELGRRDAPTFAARRIGRGEGDLVVVEQSLVGDAATDDAAARFVRCARRVSTLRHRNVAKVLDVVVRDDEVAVVSELVDGETYDALGDDAPPLGIRLRILAEALAGLAVLHGLRGPDGALLDLVHDDVTPLNILVGLDGFARLARATRPQRPAGSSSATPDPFALYRAPETRGAVGAGAARATITQRADLYAIGVMLWEALSGNVSLSMTGAQRSLASLLSGAAPLPTLARDTAWATSLGELARRTLSEDPTARPATAAEMDAEIRRVAGIKLATTAQVAAFVRTHAGARVAARRAALVAMPAMLRIPTSITKIVTAKVATMLDVSPRREPEPQPQRQAEQVARREESLDSSDLMDDDGLDADERPSDRPTVPAPAPAFPPPLALPTPIAMPSMMLAEMARTTPSNPPPKAPTLRPLNAPDPLDAPELLTVVDVPLFELASPEPGPPSRVAPPPATPAPPPPVERRDVSERTVLDAVSPFDAEVAVTRPISMPSAPDVESEDDDAEAYALDAKKRRMRAVLVLVGALVVIILIAWAAATFSSPPT